VRVERDAQDVIAPTEFANRTRSRVTATTSWPLLRSAVTSREPT
jgi:hypothetical protein